MKNAITVETFVHAPAEKVWDAWVKPEHIMGWTFASDDWHAPLAENDVREGGRFKTRMEAKDKSAGFDFSGVYTQVQLGELIEYTMDDGRKVKVVFTKLPEGVRVTETFEAEQTNSREKQQSGWQSILDNFKQYVERMK